MDESTTTAPIADNTGVDTSTQPVEQLSLDAAETPTTEQQTDQQTASESTSEAIPSDDNLDWVKNSKGIDPTTPEGAAKLAGMYREAEKLMHEKSAAASNLEKSISQSAAQATGEPDPTTDPTATLEARVRAMETQTNVNQFFSRSDIDASVRPVMAKMATENPTLAALVENKYLSLDQFYAMAVGSDPNRATSLKLEGGREALQKVADKQSGKAVQGQATSSAFSSEEKSDPFRDALLGKI